MELSLPMDKLLVEKLTLWRFVHVKVEAWNQSAIFLFLFYKMLCIKYVQVILYLLVGFSQLIFGSEQQFLCWMLLSDSC